MNPAHHNWIDGEARPALGGGVFKTAGSEERWPRSDAADARLALDLALRAAADWNATDPARRAALVGAALESLEGAHARLAPVAAALDLAPTELASRFAGLASVAPRGAERRSACVVVCAPHWSEFGRAALELARVLAGGEVALVLADPHLPWIAECIVRAFVEAGVPAGVLALLHDDGDRTLRALVQAPELARLESSGPPALVARHMELVQHLGRAPILVARTLRSESCIVGREEDPSRAAERVLELAFGRARALFGQAPEQVGRVLCQRHVFSSFSAALFERLETWPALPAPLERASAVHLAEALELGLDEGATLVHRGARARPLVFTNVEPRMRLARLARPAPLLCLLRVEDPGEAAQLALELDHDPAADDLANPRAG